MNVDLGIKLQAYLDGELAGSEAREVTSLIESDSDARTELSPVHAVARPARETGADVCGDERHGGNWCEYA